MTPELGERGGPTTLFCIDDGHQSIGLITLADHQTIFRYSTMNLRRRLNRTTNTTIPIPADDIPQTTHHPIIPSIRPSGVISVQSSCQVATSDTSFINPGGLAHLSDRRSFGGFILSDPRSFRFRASGIPFRSGLRSKQVEVSLEAKRTVEMFFFLRRLGL